LYTQDRSAHYEKKGFLSILGKGYGEAWLRGLSPYEWKLRMANMANLGAEFGERIGGSMAAWTIPVWIEIPHGPLPSASHS